MRRLLAILLFGLIALAALRPDAGAAVPAPACLSAAGTEATLAAYGQPQPAPRQSTRPGGVETACNLQCARSCQAAVAGCRAPPAVCQQQRAACLRGCGC